MTCAGAKSRLPWAVASDASRPSTTRASSPPASASTSSLDPGTFEEFDSLVLHRATDFGIDQQRYPRRLRRHRLRTHRGPARLRLRAGLHRRRRQRLRGRGREDLQGHGPRDEDRRADHRHQRRRRRAHPGRRLQPQGLRRDLPPQRPRLRRHPADLGHPRPGRRWRRLLALDHRLRLHGRRPQLHVHHRPGRRAGRDDGRGHGRGARRRQHPRHALRRRPLRHRDRRDRASPRCGACSPSCPRTTSTTRRSSRWATTLAAATRTCSPSCPRTTSQPYDVREVIYRIVDSADFLEVHADYAQNIVVGFARHGRPHRGHRRQPAAVPRRHARHRRVAEGGALRPLLRLLQHPDRHASPTSPATCRARRRSTAASSPTAPSWCTPTPRRRCRR